MTGDFIINPSWIDLGYLVAAVLFILGLKGLTHPRTAVRGNLMSGVGMLIAATVTLLAVGLDYWIIIVGVIIGAVIGAAAAVLVQMTAMPQMVALFNGFGGGASVCVAAAAFYMARAEGGLSVQVLVATAASGLIGAVTFWGSLVAYGKLQGVKWVPSGQVLFKGQSFVNALFAVLAVVAGAALVLQPEMTGLYWLVVLLASILGILLVIAIGGADMPVVIALLNSYSGLAAAATGFVLSNNVLIIAGSLVGASGIILTQIMCRAMNRSLTNVLFGVMGPSEATATDDEVYAGKVKSAQPEELAMLLEGARRVVFVPGYGMAVSQAQHAVRSLANLLEQRGAEVQYALHPVAGRMPGHMNVLLAEADVPYDQLTEMDDINESIDQVDVAIVIGANDVVNPLARTDPSSPIAGMPIIDVDRARNVIVIKRSLSPGFAGIPNPLFANDNTLMFFSDGKKAINDLIAAVKEL